jgi:hypothetical protein
MTPNPQTGRKAGLNHLNQGLGKAAHQGLASGSRRDVRPRPTQGRGPPAQGNAKLPERPRDESGPRETRPACLNSAVSQVAVQCQGRGPKAPKRLDRHQHEGQGGGHLPIRAPLGGVPGSGRKLGGARSTPSKGCSCWVDDGNVTHQRAALL